MKAEKGLRTPGFDTAVDPDRPCPAGMSHLPTCCHRLTGNRNRQKHSQVPTILGAETMPIGHTNPDTKTISVIKSLRNGILSTKHQSWADKSGMRRRAGDRAAAEGGALGGQRRQRPDPMCHLPKARALRRQPITLPSSDEVTHHSEKGGATPRACLLV